MNNLLATEVTITLQNFQKIRHSHTWSSRFPWCPLQFTLNIQPFTNSKAPFITLQKIHVAPFLIFAPSNIKPYTKIHRNEKVSLTAIKQNYFSLIAFSRHHFILRLLICPDTLLWVSNDLAGRNRFLFEGHGNGIAADYNQHLRIKALPHIHIETKTAQKATGIQTREYSIFDGK